MIGVMYISNQEYFNGSQTTGTSVPTYPIGYHGIIGDTISKPTTAKKCGSGGYGIGNMFGTSYVINGCIHPIDSIKETLELIINLISTYHLTEFTVITADPYLIKVFHQWLPNWKETATKDNGVLLDNQELWLSIKQSNIKFIPWTTPDIGQVTANIFSMSITAWSNSIPHANPNQETIPNLCWANTLVLDKHNDVIQLVNTVDAIEIGNMDPATTYGIVFLNQPSKLLTELRDWSNLSATRVRLLNLQLLRRSLVNRLLIENGTNILSKPLWYEDNYGVGNEELLITDLYPWHKYYIASSIHDILYNILNKLITVNLVPGTYDNVVISDVSRYLFNNGKLVPSLNDGDDGIKLPMPVGKPKYLCIAKELPPILVIRRLAKDNGKIFIGCVLLDGIVRTFYVLQSGEGVGIYTTWISKQYTNTSDWKY